MKASVKTWREKIDNGQLDRILIDLYGDENLADWQSNYCTAIDAFVEGHGAHGEIIIARCPSQMNLMGMLRVAQRNGWDWVAFAYRGYPGSSGTPSEAGITLDARAAWDFVVEELGIGPDRIVLHGRSLGGAVAATLAEEVQPAGLVLESTPRSVLELAIPQAPGLPVGALLKHPFRTDLRAPGIRTPTLVVHSSDDHVVPVEHGRWLASTIPDAQLLEVTGHRHGELLPVRNPSIRQAWLAFLDARCPPVRANPAPP